MKYLVEIPGDTDTDQGQHNGQPHRKAKSATHGVDTLPTPILEHARIPRQHHYRPHARNTPPFTSAVQSIVQHARFQPVKSIS
jgi:hypothetical protein